MSDTEIIVCTTCRPPGASRDLPAQGLALFEAVQDALLVCELDTGEHKGLQLRGLACMSGCSRACTASRPTRFASRTSCSPTGWACAAKA